MLIFLSVCTAVFRSCAAYHLSRMAGILPLTHTHFCLCKMYVMIYLSISRGRVMESKRTKLLLSYV